MRRLLGFLLLALASTACSGASSSGPTAPTKLDKRSKNPCVSCEPESFCAGWSLPEDRTCTTDADCVRAVVKWDSVDCPWGLFGGFAEAASSKAAEARVKARMQTVDPCTLRDHLHVGTVCGAPELTCVKGSCGYDDSRGPVEQPL